jgi:hypothetical protein
LTNEGVDDILKKILSTPFLTYVKEIKLAKRETKEAVIVSLDEKIPEQISKILDEFTPEIKNVKQPDIPVQVDSLKPRLVKLVGLRTFEACIGREWYRGEKDKTMLVPDFVAEALLRNTQNPKVRMIV